MRRALFLVMCLLLTGCSNSHNPVQDVQDDLGWVVDDESENVLPSEFYEGGESIFGNGKSEDSSDIFTVLENKIWGN